MKSKMNLLAMLDRHVKGKWLFLCLLMISCLCATSQAGLHPLTKVTSNSPDLVVNPWQFTVDVQDFSPSQILLTFTNNTPDILAAMTSAAVESSITGIYIDDAVISFNSFMGLVTDSIEFINNGSGKLPSGCPYGFTTDDFYAAAEASPVIKGINPGESLGLLFDYGGGVFEDIDNAIGSGTLPIGLQVVTIQYDDNVVSKFSESFIVPEPVTFILLGLGGLCTRSNKNNRRVAKPIHQ
ncbi:MAG: hypothetical protein H8E62_07080 [Planctomycetes bacterium]|nr:hypothetical protein [Planctomycetota bacterium]